MNVQKVKERFFFVLLFVTFAVAGIGGINVFIRVFISFFCLSILFVFAYLKKRKILFPKIFSPYLIFLAILVANFLWSKDQRQTIIYIFLFFIGGLYWIVAYNFKKELARHFDTLIIGLGFVFLGILAFHLLTGTKIPYDSIYSFTSSLKDHNHIGDYWVLILILVLNDYFCGKRQVHRLFLLPVGLAILVFSLSRSAYLSLFLSAIYLFFKHDFKISKKQLYIFYTLIGALFLYASFSKTFFFSRPYFYEAAYGLFLFPLGVGMGNFTFLLQDKRLLKYFETVYESVFTHNIILEVTVGIGVLSLFFVAWLLMELKRILFDRNKATILYSSLSISLLVNFLFDTTYFIPVMLWLWFFNMGLAREN